MKKSFREMVYEITNRIPKGKVATYGQIAKMAGKPKAARAVGLFMKQNPDIPNTPCHRIVASNGKLTGYSSGEGIKTKREILKSEGVSFINESVDLKKSKWNLI